MDPAMIMTLLSLATSVAGGLTGSKGETKSTYDKGTLNLLDQVQQYLKGGVGGQNQDINQQPGYQTGMDWLQGLYNDPSFFDAFESPLLRQFNEEIAPGIANRFASQGSGGSLGSTGFRNAITRAGADLSTNIGALRGGMQQQGIPQLQSYAQQPVSNWMQQLQASLIPTQNVYQPPSSGFFGGLAAPFAQGASQIYGQRAGQQSANPGQSPLTY
jgi:hypothetical protein